MRRLERQTGGRRLPFEAARHASRRSRTEEERERERGHCFDVRLVAILRRSSREKQTTLVAAKHQRNAISGGDMYVCVYIPLPYLYRYRLRQ